MTDIRGHCSRAWEGVRLGQRVGWGEESQGLERLSFRSSPCWARGGWSSGLGAPGLVSPLRLQKWLQSLQLRRHSSCCTLTAGTEQCLPPLGNMVPGHLSPISPLSKDIPRGHLHVGTLLIRERLMCMSSIHICAIARHHSTSLAMYWGQKRCLF